MNYSHEEEGLRVVSTGNSAFKIRLDRSSSLWTIESDAGLLPVVLRDKHYTAHRFAYNDIKNYIDGHAERKIVYKNPKKES